MARTLHPQLAWVAGPAAGAFYDLATGRVHAVDPAGAALLNRELDSGRPVEDWQPQGPAETAWHAALLASDWVGEYEAIPARTPFRPSLRGRPRLIWFELTGRCNYRCLHCYADSDPSPDHPSLPDERWHELIREAAALGFPHIQFTGGDPCMHPSLWSFVEQAHAAGFASVEVYTNGSLLRARDIERMARWGTRVALSFYSPDPAVYETVTQTPGSLPRFMRNLRRLLELQVPVRIGLVDLELPGQDLAAARQAMIDMGVPPDAIRSDGVRPSGRGNELLAQGCGGGASAGSAATSVVPLERLLASPDTPPEPAIWRAPMPRPDRFRQDAEGPRWNTCWEGEIVVDPEGRVYPCIFARELPLGDVAEFGLAALLNSAPLQQAWSRKLDDSHDCEVCEYRYACFDCRALTHNVTGDLTAKPPSCIYDPYTARSDWDRWWRQQPDPAGWDDVRLQLRDGWHAGAEAADGVLWHGPGGALARLPWLAAALADLAAGPGKHVAELCALLAAETGEPPEVWRPRVVQAGWELAAQGLAGFASSAPRWQPDAVAV